VASRISAAALTSVATALQRGALPMAASRAQLGRLVADGEIHDIALLLKALLGTPMDRAQAAVALHLLAEAKRDAESAPRPQLVWSDLDLRGSRDTSVVAHELFREAKKYVLVSTYNLGHKRRDGEPVGHPVLRPLAERMAEVPKLRARMFINLRRMPWQTDATDDQVLADFGRWFHNELWPWPRLPELYFDPRSLDGGEDSACLHAKCIVVDDEHSFVTSANLTEAAQMRNIEAGVLLHDPTFAKNLRLQFEALISRKLVLPVPLGPELSPAQR
jgi:phosphatidylserine/phosphatidylglycerophosphate/cardiolipin synthase-like enzyme